MGYSRQEKLLLAVLSSVQFCHIVDFVIMMPLNPFFTRAFGMSPKEFGLLVSSYSLAAGCTGLLSSFFVDRFDRKSTLVFFACGFTLGTLACGFASGYGLLLAARCVAGAFGGVLGSLALSIIADAFPYERRGAAMGLLFGSFSVASVFGVPMGLFLANEFGWNAPFLVLGGLAAIVTFGASVMIPSMRGHITAAKRPLLEAYAHILRTPNQLWALMFLVCLILGQFSIIPFLSASFVTNAGLTEGELPLIYLFGGLCSMIASPMAGRLSDKHGKKPVFMISAVLSIVPIILITNLGPHPHWMLFALSSAFFIVMSGRMVPAMAMISATATPAYRGSFMSVTSAVQQFASASASFMAGLIVVTGEGGRLERYDRVGAVAVLFSLFAFFITWRLKVAAGQSQSLLER